MFRFVFSIDCARSVLLPRCHFPKSFISLFLANAYVNFVFLLNGPNRFCYNNLAFFSGTFTEAVTLRSSWQWLHNWKVSEEDWTMKFCRDYKIDATYRRVWKCWDVSWNLNRLRLLHNIKIPGCYSLRFQIFTGLICDIISAKLVIDMLTLKFLEMNNEIAGGMCRLRNIERLRFGSVRGMSMTFPCLLHIAQQSDPPRAPGSRRLCRYGHD